MIHRRDYRPVTPDDISTAIRMLGIERRSDRQVMNLKEAHDNIDMFASAVISAACEQVIRERNPQ